MGLNFDQPRCSLAPFAWDVAVSYTWEIGNKYMISPLIMYGFKDTIDNGIPYNGLVGTNQRENQQTRILSTN